MRFSGGIRLRRRVKTLFHRLRFLSGRFWKWKSSKQGRLSWFQRASVAFRRAFGSSRPRSGYIRLGKETSTVPKGYLAVYVGRHSTGEYERIMVPVIQFNHPLFRELLKQAEAEFGYEHPGGITIPCRVSEFEDVRMRIAGTEMSRRRMKTWRNVKSW